MYQEFRQFYEKNEKMLLKDISDTIAFESIAKDADGEDNPFGKEVTNCLNHILTLGERMGMTIKNIDNYIGEITIGNGKHMIGILCHADVVDAGDGWKSDPFHAIIENGELYGRGVIDDKGPMICCLYAMKYINENCLLPEDCRIRMIIGTDEEENWVSMDKYRSMHPEFPEVSIVPDANFPVIFCEKGLINLTLHVPVSKDSSASLRITDLSGGERSNVVPTTALCRIAVCRGMNISNVNEYAHNVAKEYGINMETDIENNEILRIVVTGKAAHAMTPEKGTNAISGLMKILMKLTTFESGTFSPQNVVQFYEDYIGFEYNGEKLGINWSDIESGALTVNVGVLEMSETEMKLVLNIRYPVDRTFEEVSACFQKICEPFGISLEFGVCMDPIYFDRNSQMIKVLLGSYQKFTGDTESHPIALGGATYARAIPNAVAFGPVFPNQEELAHEANEHYTVSDFRRITEIYADALLKLCDLSVNEKL